ncbi:MAG: hypothetical protein E6J34_00210 [Chloroflexi bacterium]|nr:MAG: hypothetical protein E6J34_00210 [Chloroflexota bacterium]
MTEIDGPGRWSCRESENSKEVLEDSEKYRSTASLFHLPIRMISVRDMPAFSAELAAPRRKE